MRAKLLANVANALGQHCSTVYELCTRTRMSSMFILSHMHEFNLILEKFYIMAIVAVV